MRPEPYRGIPLGKPIKSENFVYGWPIPIGDRIIIIPEEWVTNRHFFEALEYGLRDETDELVYKELLSDCVEVVPATVGQQVGKQDKNGKKIYAADTMQSKDRLRKYVVTWHDRQGCWYLKGLGKAWVVHTPMWEEYEIIGTIHDTEQKNGD